MDDLDKLFSQDIFAIMIVAVAGFHLVRIGRRRLGALLRISSQPTTVCGSCHQCQETKVSAALGSAGTIAVED